MFVTTEGLDGAGKDTALDAITGEYPDAVITSEPSDLWTGKKVREVLSDESSPPLMDFYLFMADRIHHIKERIRPADERGDLVVSGRYADSTRVYQPVALSDAGIFENQLIAKNFIEETMRPWNYEPEVTLYLNISPETALERAAGDEKYEKYRFLQKVKHNYDELATLYEDRFVVIDAEQSQDAVREDVVRELDKRIE